jgi:hypothetical protein
VAAALVSGTLDLAQACAALHAIVDSLAGEHATPSDSELRPSQLDWRWDERPAVGATLADLVRHSARQERQLAPCRPVEIDAFVIGHASTGISLLRPGGEWRSLCEGVCRIAERGLAFSVTNFDDVYGFSALSAPLYRFEADRVCLPAPAPNAHIMTAGHDLLGRWVFPATGYAVAAAHDVGDTLVTVKALAILRPVFLDSGERIDAQRSSGDGREFLVAGEVVAHATIVGAGQPRVLQHPEIAGPVLDQRAFYSRLRDSGYEYSGRYQSVERATFSGSHAHLELAPDSPWECCLDAALQAQALLCAGDDDREHIWLPTRIEEIVFAGGAGRPHTVTVACVRPADGQARACAAFFARDGRPIASISDATFRPLPLSFLAREPSCELIWSERTTALGRRRSQRVRARYACLASQR